MNQADIRTMGLSNRVENLLYRRLRVYKEDGRAVVTVGNIMSITDEELMGFRNFGAIALAELRAKIPYYDPQTMATRLTVLDSCWWSPMPPMVYVGAVAVTWDDKPGTYSAYIGTYTNRPPQPQSETEELIARRGARLAEEQAANFFPEVARTRSYVVGD